MKLTGRFDIAMASELLMRIGDESAGLTRVFIDTDRVECISPLGRTAFYEGLRSLGEERIRIVLAGDKAIPLAPNFGNLL